MQELHAFANGDGTYSAQIISIVNGRVQQYTTPNVAIKVEEDVVWDSNSEDPNRRVVQFTFTNGPTVQMA